MPRKPEPLLPWMTEAIDLMVRHDLTLRQAAQQLDVDVTPQQADNMMGRTRFKQAFDDARLAYYEEIGSSPRINRETIIGQMYLIASKLEASGEPYKAADVLLKLSKTRGWVGEGDTRTSVFAGLSFAELQEVRAELEMQNKGTSLGELEPADEKSDAASLTQTNWRTNAIDN